MTYISILFPEEHNSSTDATLGTNVAHDVVSSMSRMNARSSGADASRAPNQAGDSTSMYFERSVLITNEVWTPAPFVGGFFVFERILSDPRIREKLNQFSLIKFDLEIEIDLIGNPFTYGQMIVFWTPYPKHDALLYDSPLPPTDGDLSQYTQRQHVLLDVSVSSSVKMKIPFYWPYEMFDLLCDDPADFGFLRLMTMNDLRHVSGGNPQVSYIIRARMVNCEVSVNTANQTGSLPMMEVQAKFKKQGRTHGDEKTGATLSSWASRGAALAHASIPLTGEYGIATKAAMSAAAGMLAAVGLSHPRSNEEPTRIGNDPFGNMANHNVGQDVINLGLDCENEVSYSPEITGIVEDEMSFDHILKKETYIGRFSWDQTQQAGSTVGYVAVEPMKVIRDQGGKIFTTPLAHIGQMFSYWTGSLKFRFQFVSSQFHRGRVRILHEPRYFDDIIDEDSRWTTNQLAVIDIQDEKDFSIEVDWAQARPWALNRRIQDAIDPVRSGLVTPYPTSALIEANGVLVMNVVNVMTIPDMTQVAPIDINVYVSAGHDFRYTALRHDFSNLHFTPAPTPPPTPSGQILSTQLISGLIQNGVPMPDGSWLSAQTGRFPVWATDPTTPIQITIEPDNTGTLTVTQGGDPVFTGPVVSGTSTDLIMEVSTPTSGQNFVDLDFSQQVLVTNAILPVKPGYRYKSNVVAGDFKADFTNDLSTPGGDYPYQQNMGALGAPQLRWTIGGPTGLYAWRNHSSPIYVTYVGSIRTTNGIYGPNEFTASSPDWAVMTASPAGSWSSNTFQIMPQTPSTASIRSVVFLEVQSLEVQADIVSNGESDVVDTDPGVLTTMSRSEISGALAYKYFGEQYTHVRQLLGRWDFQEIFYTPAPSFPPPSRFYSYEALPAYPYRAEALDPGGAYLQSILSAHQWLISPYNGMRGSYRIRYHVECDSPVMVQSCLLPPANFFTGRSLNNDGNLPSDDILFKTFHGVRWQDSRLNPSISVEVPYFTRKKFLPCAARSASPSNATSVCTLTGFRSSNASIAISRYLQAGDDFTVVNWIATPILYEY